MLQSLLRFFLEASVMRRYVRFNGLGVEKFPQHFQFNILMCELHEPGAIVGSCEDWATSQSGTMAIPRETHFWILDITWKSIQTFRFKVYCLNQELRIFRMTLDKKTNIIHVDYNIVCVILCCNYFKFLIEWDSHLSAVIRFQCCKSTHRVFLLNKTIMWLHKKNSWIFRRTDLCSLGFYL